MNRFLLVLLCGIFFFSCLSRKSKEMLPIPTISTVDLIRQDSDVVISVPDTILIPPVVALSMERQSCLIGNCPTYKVEFFENGVVRYFGKSFVDKQGNYEARIDLVDLERLLLLAKNIGYFDFNNVYPTVGEIIYEVPLTITFVKYYSMRNAVENHHNAPVSLIRFEEHIEELIENLDWEKIEE